MSEGAASYDPDERHETPLALRIKARIRDTGPMPLDDYFRQCLYDREHGYYRRAGAIGGAADFITAPEISQCFGEIIGLWAAVVWQQMGKPAPFHLVELGPGRGTMLRDMLRAMRLVPGLLDAAHVELIETSSTLAASQRTTLAGTGAPLRWHDALPVDLPYPAIVIGNEFLDTFPVQQWTLTGDGWRRRTVRLDARHRLVFGHGDAAAPPPLAGLPPPQLGDILERAPEQIDFVRGTLARLAASRPLVALLIDYGHATSGFGDTVQAVRAHRHVSPLAYPGESDLTAQVDFDRLCQPLHTGPGDDASAQPSTIDGPITQAEFLGRLGIVERASRLMAANPQRALQIEAGVKRLLDPNGMGGRFKAMTVRSADLPPPPPFDCKTGGEQRAR